MRNWIAWLYFLFVISTSGEVRVFIQEENHAASLKYECTSGEIVRAFALDVSVDHGQIRALSNYFRGESTAAVQGYGFFPAAFRDHLALGAGTNIHWEISGYTPLAVVSDRPDDTLPGLNTSGVTLEFGGLWDPLVGAAVPPASGTLCTFRISEVANVTVAPNLSRGGIMLSPPDFNLTQSFTGGLVDPELRAITGLKIFHGMVIVHFVGGELIRAATLDGSWIGTGNTNGVYTASVKQEASQYYRVRQRGSGASALTGRPGAAWSGKVTPSPALTYSSAARAAVSAFTGPAVAGSKYAEPAKTTLRPAPVERVASKATKAFAQPSSAYRNLGYSYLSPLPSSEYCSERTRYVLVRFQNISPRDLTNLSTSFITVTGDISGDHPGTTRIAWDGQTVIFTMTNNFAFNELVTVALNPALRPAVGGVVLPYHYRFAISTHMPDPGVITVRGDSLPNGSKENAFDQQAATKWVDVRVPDGATNYSWIQFQYPGNGMPVINQYSLTAAGDFPERDPKDWRFYGVDATGGLVLLDTQTNQVFSHRGGTNTYPIDNVIGYRGFRLEITRVNHPATANAVQLAELEFRETRGAILREVWINIPGATVTDLTRDPNFPDHPSASNLLPSFEAPMNWANHYGTRLRGFITAPATGDFLFWIASDEHSELWLSPDPDPAHRQLIASSAGWTYLHEWNKYPGQQSEAIRLIAGQKYYIEALHKEDTGGNHVAVSWAKPGQSLAVPSEIIPGSVLTPWNSAASASFIATAPAGHSFMSGRVRSEFPVNTDGLGFAPRRSSGSGQTLGYPVIMPNGVSVPSGFPQLAITINDNPDQGYIFIDTRGGGGQPYNVIFDNQGWPVWYQLMPDEYHDMRVQPNGLLTIFARAGGYRFDGLNSNYVTVMDYWTDNGYAVDEHELHVLPNGNYFLIGLVNQTVDMSRYVAGGNPWAIVTEQVVQGFTPAKELIFQWRAWDHLDIRDQQQFIDIAFWLFDFPHLNSIHTDTDGHLLVTSRNTSETTKINRDTGEIIWRLGGVHNQFRFLNDPLNGPRNPHSVSVVKTNQYLLFDNGNLHQPPVSRGVEYLLDPVQMTAQIVWQYPATPTTNFFSHYMGNTQRLPNGNTLINWAVGNLPKLTEVRPDGTVAYEMNWADGYEAYRVWRCPWQGKALKPNLVLEPRPDKLTLIFNQFGDTNVAYYRIYGGTAPHPTQVLATSPITMASLWNLQNQTRYYFRVTAVSRDGAEGDFSDEQSVFIDLIQPGRDLMANGDFALGSEAWTWTNRGTASATWDVIDGASQIRITSPGTALTDIQLQQAGLKMIQGSQYVLEFDAWSSARRVIEVRLGQDQAPWSSYLIVSPTLTPARKHFTYTLDMQKATDMNARLEFDLGAVAYDVYLDNVALWRVAPGDLNRDRCVNYADLAVLTGQWLQQGGGLTADLNGDGCVNFQDYAILAENWSGDNCSQ